MRAFECSSVIDGILLSTAAGSFLAPSRECAHNTTPLAQMAPAMTTALSMEASAIELPRTAKLVDCDRPRRILRSGGAIRISQSMRLTQSRQRGDKFGLEFRTIILYVLQFRADHCHSALHLIRLEDAGEGSRWQLRSTRVNAGMIRPMRGDFRFGRDAKTDSCPPGTRHCARPGTRPSR
jgi:hypothetical protein